MTTNTLIKIAGAALLGAALTGCAPEVFTPDVTSDTSVRANYSAAVSIQTNITAPWSGLVKQEAATLEYQRITLTVTDGLDDDSYIDINADGSITGFAIYPLGDVAAADALFVRGTAISYQARRISENGVEILMPLTEDSIDYDYLEVEINPATATFNGGTARLDTDGDRVSGEANEDLFVDFVSVSSGGTAGTAITTLSSGNFRAPCTAYTLGRSVNFSSFENTTGTNAVRVTFTSTGPLTSLNKASLQSGIQIEKLNTVTGAWATVAPGYDYNGTTGVLSLNFKTAAGEVYRYRQNPYNYAESVAVNGYIHRASYNQTNGFTDNSWTYRAISSADKTFETVTGATLGGVKGSWFLDVETSAENISAATLTVSAVRVFNINADGIPSEVEGFTLSKTSPSTYRINLPARFTPFVNGSIKIMTAPSVIDTDDTDATTDDDSFTGATFNGWSVSSQIYY